MKLYRGAMEENMRRIECELCFSGGTCMVNG